MGMHAFAWQYRRTEQAQSVATYTRAEEAMINWMIYSKFPASSEHSMDRRLGNGDIDDNL